MNLNIPFDTTSLFVNNAEWKHFPVQNLINDKNDRLTDVLSEFDKVSGIYIFWWSGSIEKLEQLNRKILIQGKRENDSFKWLPIEWQIEWLVPQEFERKKHLALYVGKSTTLRNRIRNHFHFPRNRQTWKERLKKNVTLSVLACNDTIDQHFVAERFYLEDFLIGALRPWFNLDSEKVGR